MSIGVGSFILDKISATNPYFIYLIATLLFEVCLFVVIILKALYAYKPSLYFITPAEPKRFIEKYANLTKTHVIRETATTMADIVMLNRKTNLKKVRSLDWISWLTIFGTIGLVFFAVFAIAALGIPPLIDP